MKGGGRGSSWLAALVGLGLWIWGKEVEGGWYRGKVVIRWPRIRYTENREFWSPGLRGGDTQKVKVRINNKSLFQLGFIVPCP